MIKLMMIVISSLIIDQIVEIEVKLLLLFFCYNDNITLANQKCQLIVRLVLLNENDQFDNNFQLIIKSLMVDNCSN